MYSVTLNIEVRLKSLSKFVHQDGMSVCLSVCLIYGVFQIHELQQYNKLKIKV